MQKQYLYGLIVIPVEYLIIDKLESLTDEALPRARCTYTFVARNPRHHSKAGTDSTRMHLQFS